MIVTTRRIPGLAIVATLILGIVFVLRVFDLNYNAPFNDEAIYIVIGKLGLFQWDWTSYNTSNWMAGIPFFYPSIAALSYITGGIVGARLFNVVVFILLLEAIFMITFFLTDQTIRRKITAGMLSVVLVGGASVSYYVSRIATYDMPSYYFLFLCIAIVLYVNGRVENRSKWYFFAFLSLFMSFGMKLTTGYFYIPPLVIISYLLARKNGRKQISQWKKYFLVPLGITLAIYLLFNLNTLGVFFSSQVVARDKADIGTVMQVFWENSTHIWFFWVLGSVGLLLKREWKKWLLLTAAAFWILIGHLVSARVPTLDKHTFISVAFASIIGGIGMIYLYSALPKVKIVRSYIAGSAIGIIAIFWYISFLESARYNYLWTNTSEVLGYLQESVEPGDKLLTEIGAATMLSTYDKNHPSNVTTFDWFEYHGISGQEAYLLGVKDGYFDFIVLETQERPKSENNKETHNLAVENIGDLYHKSYDKDGFYVYEKAY